MDRPLYLCWSCVQQMPHLLEAQRQSGDVWMECLSVTPGNA
jgi:hypothetical protein